MKKMNKKYSLNGHLILYILLSILAVVAASKVATLANNHEPLIMGFLSVATLYFVCLLFLYSESPLVRKYKGYQVKFPRDINLIVEVFFLFLIAYWSLGYIINAIKYIYYLIR